MRERIRNIVSGNARGFARYFAIGISGVVLDIGSLYALKEYAGFSPAVSVAINQLFMLNYVFFLNKYWAFGSLGTTHREMIRFYSLAVANWLFSVAWIWALSSFGANYLLARLLNIALAVLWNYVLYRSWVFKKEA